MLKILLYVTFVFCLEDTHAVYSYVVPLCAAYVYVLYLLYLYNIYIILIICFKMHLHCTSFYPEDDSSFLPSSQGCQAYWL